MATTDSPQPPGARDPRGATAPPEERLDGPSGDRVRTLRAEPCEAEARRFREIMDALRPLRAEAAKLLGIIEDAGHYLLEGCASAAEFATRIGRLDPGEAHALVGLSRAMRTMPTIQERFLDGSLMAPAAAQLGRLRLYPAILGSAGSAASWIQAAQVDAPRTFRRKVDAEIEKHRQAVPGVVELTVHIAEETRDDFQRAREVASRRKHASLTEGQAFKVVVDHYLDDYDPSRVRVAPRPNSPMEESAPRERALAEDPADRAKADEAAPVRRLRRNDRYISAGVRRAVRARSGDACEAEGCANRTFRQLAHIVPHAAGGTRGADDLLDLCTTHHALFDAGLLKLEGWCSAGKPLLVSSAKATVPVSSEAGGNAAVAGHSRAKLRRPEKSRPHPGVILTPPPARGLDGPDPQPPGSAEGASGRDRNNTS